MTAVERKPAFISPDIKEPIISDMWQEISEPDNAFVAAQCRCAGFDIFGDLLGKASWIEYLYLMFHRQPANARQAQLLNGLAIALANPGPRDYSVQAAMSAGAGGSSAASALIAALAVGAGQLGGSRELYLCMTLWERCGTQTNLWQETLESLKNGTHKTQRNDEVWLACTHPPGFDNIATQCARPVRQTLTYLCSVGLGTHLNWLQQHREFLEQRAGYPLALSCVAAAAFRDLGFDAEQGESLYLLMRLPGAAAHALEQRRLGWRDYPFHAGALEVTNDPGPHQAEGYAHE